MSKEVKFLEGVFVKKAPTDFLCINGTINIDKFGQWLRADGKQFISDGKFGKEIRFTIKESKSGNTYVSVNTWKPKDKVEETVQEVFPDAEPLPDGEDAPF